MRKSFNFSSLVSTIPGVKDKPFVHLHVHTSYSLLDGLCRVGDLMDSAVQMGMPAIAMTDHGVMSGAIEFYKTGRAKGIKPLIGCEMYITANRRDRKTETGKSYANHLVLLATNDAGYHNLIKLVTMAHMEGFYYKPRIDREILQTHSKGLIGLSACLKGEVACAIEAGDVAGAIRAAGEYGDIFGKDNFFLEVQDHRIPEQRTVNKHLGEVARKAGLRIVATNDVHYIKKEHAAAHEVLLCLQTQTVMSDPKRMKYRTDEFYLKSRDEMEALFKDFPGSIDITMEIAERCNVELEFGKLHFPTFDVPKGMDQKQYLLKLGHEGMTRCYGINDPANPANDSEREVMDRFDSEMKVIEKTGFINYFLVVADFVRFAHESEIPVGPGRGSGGGSIVAYALGITAIDPIRYSLIFERFLNPERVSPPDFDIDFCQSRRGEVIDYVKRKYGRENVAQIATFGTLGAKTVIRDVGRVLEIPFGRCDQLAKFIPDDPKITLEDALEQSPDFKRAYNTEEDCKRILDHGFVLEGLHRNQGMHAAGVVIGEKPLAEIIPLGIDKDGEPVTQFTMEPLGEIGLLKMDFLGLKTLTVIDEAVRLIKETRGVAIDINNLPADDKPSYDLLNRGDTVGVFQLESTGMRDLIRRIGIDRIEDLIAMIALYRPGPMEMLPDYIDRKSGKAEIRYDHPLLEPILAETYGVMVYQEQVQKAANILAGYSLGEADLLRRAMGKKKPEEMEKQRVKFVDGCKKTHKIDAKKAESIFDTMAKFAGYGFNKAHSAGYGVISYQTAYLKANFPAEFMSVLISSEIGNMDKLPVFMNEAGTMGFEVLPPSVNASKIRFRPEGNGIRFGLAGIKNVGEGAAEAIVAEREKNGPYKSMVDFCSRVDMQAVNKKVIESLVKCGAFDCMKMHRARLFNGIDFVLARAAETVKDRRSGQGSLFSLIEEPQAATGDDVIPDCPQWHESELLAGEKDLLGIYMSGHPLTQYAGTLQRYQTHRLPDVASLTNKSPVRIGGIVASVSKKVSQRKEPWAIVQLESLDGSMDVFVFAENYQKYAQELTPNAAILVCGEVSRKDDQPKLIAFEIYPLSAAPRLFTKRLGIHIAAAHADDGVMEKVRDLLTMYPGEVPVVLCIIFPGGEKVILDTDRSLKVAPVDELVKGLEHLLGGKSVHVAVNTNTCLRQPAQRRPAWNGRQG